MALGEVAAGQPMAVVGALAQVERHHLAVEDAQDAAQRADPGEARCCRPSASTSARGSGAAGRGSSRAISSAAAMPGTTRSSTQKSPSSRSCSRVGAVLAQEAGQRLFGGAAARAALAAAAFGHPAGDPRRQRRSGAGRRNCAMSAGASGASASRDQPGKVLGRPRLHARGNLFAEQFEEKLGHGSVRLARRARPRSSPSPARGRGRYRRPARSR